QIRSVLVVGTAYNLFHRATLANRLCHWRFGCTCNRIGLKHRLALRRTNPDRYVPSSRTGTFRFPKIQELVFPVRVDIQKGSLAYVAINIQVSGIKDTSNTWKLFDCLFSSWDEPWQARIHTHPN